MANDTWSEIFREILFDIVMFGGLGMIKDKFSKKEAGAPTGEKPKGPTADEIARKILSKSDEPRGELFAFILAELPSWMSDIFRRRQTDRYQCAHKTYPDKDREKNEKYQHGDEHRFVTLLTKLFVALNGSGKNTDDERALELFVRERTFRVLAEMSDEEFDIELEKLNNDSLTQEIKRHIDNIIYYFNKVAKFDEDRSKDIKKVTGWLANKGIKSDKRIKEDNCKPPRENFGQYVRNLFSNLKRRDK